MVKKALVASMKNESPFVLEWIAFHRAIGFDNFVIASNDCEDKTDRLLDALALEGVISHRHNQVPADQDPQWVFLSGLEDHPVLRQSDWVMVLDADEFLNIRVGDGSLNDLLASQPDADAFVVLWKFFGDSGLKEWNNGLVIEKFIQCEDTVEEWNRYHKTLFRNDGKFCEFDAHYPHLSPQTPVDSVRVYNTDHQRYPDSLLIKGMPSIQYVQEKDDFWTWKNACVNHYAFKTPDLFAMKRHRGDNVPGLADEKYRVDSAYYWLRFRNSDVDTSIHRMLPKVQQELAMLRESHVIRQAEEDALAEFAALRARVIAENRELIEHSPS